MSIARRTSSPATSSLLFSYASIARQSNPPTYTEHTDSLSPPEGAFIADLARLFGNDGVRSSDAKAATSNVPSSDPDIERLQRMADDAETRESPSSKLTGKPDS